MQIENRMVVEGQSIDRRRQESPDRYDCYDGMFCYDRDCAECRGEDEKEQDEWED